MKVENIRIRVTEEQKRLIKEFAAESGFKDSSGEGNMTAYLLYLIKKNNEKYSKMF